MTVCSYQIRSTFKKENGLWSLDLDTIKLPKGFGCKKRYILNFPPGALGGNHQHSHTEVFIGLGKGMELHWLDKNKKRHRTKMQTKDQLFAFQMPPKTPHAVVNSSTKEKGILIEFADAEPTNIKAVEII